MSRAVTSYCTVQVKQAYAARVTKTHFSFSFFFFQVFGAYIEVFSFPLPLP